MIHITESPLAAIAAMSKAPDLEKIFSYYKSLFRVNFNYLDFELNEKNYSEYAHFLSEFKAQKTDTQICVKVTTSKLHEKLILAKFWDYWLLDIDEFFTKKTIFNDFFKVDQSLAQKIILLVPFSFFMAKESEHLFQEISDLKITKIRILEDEENQNLNDFEKILQMLENYNFEHFWHLKTHDENWQASIEKLHALGERNFVSCLHGLQHQIPTENLISFANVHRAPISIRTLAFEHAYNRALYLFGEQ
ncbi:hypothetical protein [Ornithobacterium rhinotracheale]